MLNMELVQGYQNLLVGIVGFAGVMITLWYGAKSARGQRKEELNQECVAISVALVAELEINLNALEEGIRRIKESSDDAIQISTESMDEAYTSFLSRIGLLSQDKVRRTMKAYLSIRTYHAHLQLIGCPVRGNDKYVKINAESTNMVAGMMENLRGPIRDAILALEE